MKRNMYVAVAVVALSLCGCSLSPIGFGGSIVWMAITLLVVAGLFTVIRFKPQPMAGPVAMITNGTSDRFGGEQITETFIAAIPSLTQELNLEVASSKQTEVFERSENKSFYGLDLGTNIVRLSVPVTYRYHIRLSETWRLEVIGSTLHVCSPPIRCGIPPSIHTDELNEITTRGWARGTPEKLAEELRHNLTPTLIEYANDVRRVDLVRDTCRRCVGEFIKRWLEGENRWRPGSFTAIAVRFADEAAIPGGPTIQLIGNQQPA